MPAAKPPAAPVTRALRPPLLGAREAPGDVEVDTVNRRTGDAHRMRSERERPLGMHEETSPALRQSGPDGLPVDSYPHRFHARGMIELEMNCRHHPIDGSGRR